MPIKESCSPLNKQKLSAPAPNARGLRSVNPPSAQPSSRGVPAPNSPAKVEMPAVPAFEQPDSYHPAGGRNR
jgi:hypothetical protein